VPDATTAAISRLRWVTTDGHLREVVDTDSSIVALEVPHVAGQPIDDVVPSHAVRIREWPNRLGILERGSEGDVVMWRTDLADEPPYGRVVAVGPRAGTVHTERLVEFRSIVARLCRLSGVDAAARPEALCCVLLTPGVDGPALESFAGATEGWAAPLPEYLGEFPGGVQLTFTASAWSRPSQYADAIERLIGEGD
jgi:hypothetical protein